MVDGMQVTMSSMQRQTVGGTRLVRRKVETGHLSIYGLVGSVALYLLTSVGSSRRTLGVNLAGEGAEAR